MKQDNYGQAKHIIKLFDIEDNESSKAVLFAEEYEKSFQKLIQIQKSKTRSAKTSVKKDRRLSVLKSVASTAAASIAAVSSASIVEELLLSFSVDLAASGLILTEPAHAHFVHAVVCFDLLCAGVTTRSACKAMLEMAKQNMDVAMGNYFNINYSQHLYLVFTISDTTLPHPKSHLHRDPQPTKARARTTSYDACTLMHTYF